MYHCVFFLCGRVKEITYKTSHLPPTQTSHDKSSCDRSRAIVGNQSVYTRYTTLSSVLGYKYKHRELSLTSTRNRPSK